MGPLIGVLVIIGVVCLLSMLLPHVLKSIPSFIGILILGIMILIVVAIIGAVAGSAPA